VRICFVCGEYPPDLHGGIGSFTQGIARTLVRHGHQVRVIGPSRLAERRSPDGAEDDAGVEVWRLPIAPGRLGWLNGRRRLSATVATWARRGEIDLVEVPDYQGWAAHWPALPVPVVTRLHGSATYFAAEAGTRTGRLTTYCEKMSLRRSDIWCSVSQYTGQRTRQLFSLPTGPAAILYNGVDVPPMPSWASRISGKVVFAGTLTEKKGITSLIDAWPAVAALNPDATLLVLGKDGAAPGGGSMLRHLQGRLPAAAAAGVQFTGHVSHARVLQELQTAQIAVLPSFAEAFALAPLEAMAAGCATIGSSLGSGPELIADGVDGMTVDPNRPQQITQAISRLRADPLWARQVAARGYEKVATRFSHATTLGANLAFFEDCVLAHRRRERGEKLRELRFAPDEKQACAVQARERGQQEIDAFALDHLAAK